MEKRVTREYPSPKGELITVIPIFFPLKYSHEKICHGSWIYQRHAYLYIYFNSFGLFLGENGMNDGGKFFLNFFSC